MPLSGMILNVTPNFTELWWHESNFPYFKYRPPHEHLSFLVLPIQNLFGFEILWRHVPLHYPSVAIFVEFLGEHLDRRFEGQCRTGVVLSNSVFQTTTTP